MQRVVPEFESVRPRSHEELLIGPSDLTPPPLDSTEGVVHRRFRRALPILLHEPEIATVERLVKLSQRLRRFAQIAESFSTGYGLFDCFNMLCHCRLLVFGKTRRLTSFYLVPGYRWLRQRLADFCTAAPDAVRRVTPALADIGPPPHGHRASNHLVPSCASMPP